MITGKGVGIALVAVFVFILVNVTRVGWLLLFDSVLWGLIALSAIIPWLAIGKLEGKRRIIRWEGDQSLSGPMEGEVVEVGIDLHNRGMLPMAFGTVDYNLDGQPSEDKEHRLFVAWMGRGKGTSNIANVVYPKRGLYKLGKMIARNSAPFGLFRRKHTLNETTQLMVLPKAYPVERLQVIGLQEQSVAIAKPARVGEQVIGSRNYHPGDPWHHIHWRNTARTGQPQLREFETESDRSITICFDGSAGQSDTEGAEEIYEDSIRVAASIGVAACSSGAQVRVVSGETDITTGDKNHLLETLAMMDRRGTATLSDHLDNVGFGSAIAIVSARDYRGIGAAQSFGTARSGLTMFAMHGYGSKDMERDTSGDSLSDAGVTVIACHAGDVGSALAEL
ncbi:MAG: DUF58 domain-containing protein [SAR202 cluster bacterium]|jgi:uncharacterized protein (DUF58 family)|nr:DUF58 domain-containing protein [SAR202 cluster bacterium]MDP6512692.1 DUF58 domain-containing protein [SAR202 cluster bacterium]MDP6716834.1 DUF58 domain-containing protein [SAR202 cluster bacterium]